MGFAHPLVEVNISAKFEENPSIGIGFIEWTRLWIRTDGRIDERTRQRESIIAPTHFVMGYNYTCISTIYINYLIHHTHAESLIFKINKHVIVSRAIH